MTQGLIIANVLVAAVLGALLAWPAIGQRWPRASASRGAARVGEGEGQNEPAGRAGRNGTEGERR